MGEPVVDVEEPDTDEAAGRPWGRVYAAVVGCFVLYLLLMAVFTRVFA